MAHPKILAWRPLCCGLVNCSDKCAYITTQNSLSSVEVWKLSFAQPCVLASGLNNNVLFSFRLHRLYFKMSMTTTTIMVMMTVIGG